MGHAATFWDMEVNHEVQTTLRGEGSHKHVYRGAGEPMEPLRGDCEDPCRVRALPSIGLVGRLSRHEASSLSVLKVGVLDAPSHSLGAPEKVV